MSLSAITNENDSSGVAAWLPWLAMSGALVGLLSALRACGHGFDFTDESFYLIWIARPFEYPYSSTQFGFIYHPIYQWLDGNIAALRRVNFLLTFSLSAVFFTLSVRRQLAPNELSTLSLLLWSATLASCALTTLVFGGMWLATPGYNSLCLQALLLAAIGLILADKRATTVSAVGWILLGLGGALTFMAKPSSAAALSVCSLVVLTISGRWRTPLLVLALASAVAGIVLGALAIDGSLDSFATRIDGGLRLARTLNDHYTVTHALRLGMPRTNAAHLQTFTAVAAGTVGGILLLGARSRQLVLSGRLLGLLAGAVAWAMLCGESPALPSLGPQGGLLLFATLLAMLTLSIGPGGIQRLYNVPRQSVALIVGFLLLPYCYAFGTVNNYWNYIAQASIFGVGASVTLLAAQPSYRRKSAALCSLALVTLLLSTQLMLDGMQRPYRQSVALAAQTRAIVVGPHHAVLQVSEDFAQYILDARNLARSAGFKPNEPMLDLSGQSPGLLFALSARSIGQPWSIGGYTGSAALTTHMLARVSCDDLARTWLLVEPNSKRRLPDTVVASFGADLAKDFSVLGSVDTPPKTNGWRQRNSQQILKPTRSVPAATAACLARRASPL